MLFRSLFDGNRAARRCSSAEERVTELVYVVFGFSSYDIEQPGASAIRFRVRTVMFSIAPHSMRDIADWVVFIRAAKSCWLMFSSIRRFTARSIRAYNGARES